MPSQRPIDRAPAFVLTTSEFEALGEPRRFDRRTPLPSQRAPVFARGGMDAQPTRAFSRVPPAPGSSIAPLSLDPLDRSGPQFITSRTRIARERSSFLRALVLMASGASVGVLLAMIAQPRMDPPPPRAAAQPMETSIARVVAPPAGTPAAPVAPARVSRGMMPPHRNQDQAPAIAANPGTTITTTVTKRDANGDVIVEAPLAVAAPPPKATAKPKIRFKPPAVTKTTLTPRSKLDERDEDLLRRAKDTETL